MEIEQLLQQKREEILKIAAKHGAYNVRVFGSVARGEATPTSDIDFLIDYDLSKTTPWFPGGLLADLEDLLGHKVDIVTEKGLHQLIRDRILSEAVPLFKFRQLNNCPPSPPELGGSRSKVPQNWEI